MRWNEKMRLVLGAALLAGVLFALTATPGLVSDRDSTAALCPMREARQCDLLRAVATLPQLGGALSVSLLGDPGQGGFCLARTDAGPRTVVAVVAGQDAEGYARLLSGAPAVLDLLAVLLLRWDDQLQANAGIAAATPWSGWQGSRPRREGCCKPWSARWRRGSCREAGPKHRRADPPGRARPASRAAASAVPDPAAAADPGVLGRQRGGEGLAARPLPGRPLWQTLRTAHPDELRAWVAR